MRLFFLELAPISRNTVSPSLHWNGMVVSDGTGAAQEVMGMACSSQGWLTVTVWLPAGNESTSNESTGSHDQIGAWSCWNSKPESSP